VDFEDVLGHTHGRGRLANVVPEVVEHAGSLRPATPEPTTERRRRGGPSPPSCRGCPGRTGLWPRARYRRASRPLRRPSRPPRRPPQPRPLPEAALLLPPRADPQPGRRLPPRRRDR
jgi:hypothetical protein